MEKNECSLPPPGYDVVKLDCMGIILFLQVLSRGSPANQMSVSYSNS